MQPILSTRTLSLTTLFILYSDDTQKDKIIKEGMRWDTRCYAPDHAQEIQKKELHLAT